MNSYLHLLLLSDGVYKIGRYADAETTSQYLQKLIEIEKETD